MNGGVLNWRGLSASIASAAAFATLVYSLKGEWHIISLALLLLIVATFAIHRASLGAQVLARAVWWSTLALGLMLCVLGTQDEDTAGLALTLECGGALLLADGRRLSEATAAAGYAPTALRGMLLLLMVFALADAETFLLFGSMPLIEGHAGDSPLMWQVMIPIGLAYVVGFVGLYRLQIWGAMVSIATSVAVLFMLLGTNLMHDIRDFAGFFIVLATVHIVTATPVTIAAIQGKELIPMKASTRSSVSAIALGGIMLLSIGFWFSHR